MLRHPEFDPVAVQFGPLAVHWYGLMYVAAFGLGWWLGRVRAADPARGWRGSDVDDMLFYVALGVVAGGRLGYMLFYDPGGALRDPLSVLRVWEGGMSFHGGLIGVIVAMLLFARRRARSFFEVADFIAPLVPLGDRGGPAGQLHQRKSLGPPQRPALGDGVSGRRRLPAPSLAALSGVARGRGALWRFFASSGGSPARPRPAMATSGLFLLAYAAFRSAAEFVRVPDRHYGYLAFDWLTMGQLLCLPMALAGAWLLWRARPLRPDESKAARPR